MLKKLFWITLLQAAGFSTALAKTELTALDEATAFARTEKVFELTVERSILSELLGKETKSKGTIFVRQNRFRFEIESPEKSQMIYDGKTLWAVTFPPAGFDDEPAQVTKTSLRRSKQDHVLLRLLTGDLIPSKSFQVKSVKSDGPERVYALATDTPDNAVKDLQVKLSGEELKQISYRDDVDNLTTLKVLKRAEVKRPAKDLFTFRVPKGAEVMEP